MKTIIMVIGLFLLGGCTEQIRAKTFGGTASINLPAGQKVVCATWKNADLWILTKPAKTGETPEILVLRESSSYGLLEGMVVITEN